MEKVPQNKSFVTGPVRLFKDDLIELHDLFHSVSTEITIVSDRTKYKDFEEFLEHRKDSTVEDFEIDMSRPYATLEISKSRSRVYISGDSIELTGLLTKASNLLKERELRKSFVFDWRTMLIIIPLMLAILFITKTTNVFLYSLVFLLYSAWTFLSDSKYVKPSSSIKVTAPGVRDEDAYKENISKVAWMIIGAVITATVGFVTLSTFHRLFPDETAARSAHPVSGESGKSPQQ